MNVTFACQRLILINANVQQALYSTLIGNVDDQLIEHKNWEQYRM